LFHCSFPSFFILVLISPLHFNAHTSPSIFKMTTNNYSFNSISFLLFPHSLSNLYHSEKKREGSLLYGCLIFLNLKYIFPTLLPVARWTQILILSDIVCYILITLLYLKISSKLINI
jgi:hypothetical protein